MGAVSADGLARTLPIVTIILSFRVLFIALMALWLFQFTNFELSYSLFRLRNPLIHKAMRRHPLYLLRVSRVGAADGRKPRAPRTLIASATN